MVHVSPWEATLGLLAGAARVLPRGGPLVLYGPYRRDGVPTAASNEAFAASLKARDPRRGLRRVEDVCAAATDAGFGFDRLVRSEERRGGTECVSRVRSGWSPDYEKKKQQRRDYWYQ